jgi:hypothetical protein
MTGEGDGFFAHSKSRVVSTDTQTLDGGGFLEAVPTRQRDSMKILKLFPASYHHDISEFPGKN